MKEFKEFQTRIIKKLIGFGYICTIIFILNIPYIIGTFQYANCIFVIENLNQESDGDIENTLAVFNFNIGCMDTPKYQDYYFSGIKSLKNYMHYEITKIKN